MRWTETIIVFDCLACAAVGRLICHWNTLFKSLALAIASSKNPAFK